MTNLSRFNFNGNQVRVVSLDNEPWFVANDICSILEIDVSDALKRLKPYEINSAECDTDSIRATSRSTQLVKIISESGLYRLILKSNKPQAEPFQDWVVQEVLPAIRKTGSYGKQELSIVEKAKGAAEIVGSIFADVCIKPEVVAQFKLNATLEILPSDMALAVEKATRQQLISSTATDEAVVTVTEIGTKLGISAIKTNKLLIEKGLQTKNPNKKSKKDPDYLPTGKGLEFAQITTAVGKDRNDTYQQLRWYPSVINQL